jgi:chemotaxis-related protein WspB
MLFLLFQLGKDRYALDAGQIAEVLPLVTIKALPLAPRGIAGLFNYHGEPVPAVDLSELALGQPARRRISTRIIVAHYADAHGGSRLLGLLAENATEAVRREPAEFADAGVHNTAAPYLGPVANDAGGLVQWVQVRHLLPEAVREALYRQVQDDTA